MGNDKKSMIAMMTVTIIAVTVSIATVIFMKTKSETPVAKKKILVEPKKKIPKKPIVKKSVHKVKPLPLTAATSEDKKKSETEEWKEAGAELVSLLQNSKFQELMKKRMAGRYKAYLKDLFEKYGIDEKTQNEIANIIADSQSKFFGEVISSGGMRGKIDDETRERLAAIQRESEEQIINLSNAAFLADAKDKRNTDQRTQYLNRLDRGMKNDKMSDDQRTAMDNLYADNQISDVERLTLPPDEIKRRQDNIDKGAKDILSETQYKKYKKTPSNSFHIGMGGGRRRVH